MVINIKNMVCRHCVSAVEDILRNALLHAIQVDIGIAKIEEEELDEPQTALLDNLLAKAGFERITDNDTLLIEKVKRTIIEHVHEQPDCNWTLSACLESHLGIPYDTLSRLFSQKEGRTIERYYIAQKIERVKELLAYKNLNLTEIAYRTGYSSAAHLSRQFKQITGINPKEYRIENCPRIPLNEV
ncbi:MAG: helix-turn-helix domain-containing protein [Paramuribaculum sp.]|nr:helix-turn-helix domain-containing protein [Paramuribaculum sp.]